MSVPSTEYPATPSLSPPFDSYPSTMHIDAIKEETSASPDQQIWP